MNETLRALFDYHRFSVNSHLEGLIRDTEERYSHVLSDDELDSVNAAGTGYPSKKLECGRGNS